MKHEAPSVMGSNEPREPKSMLLVLRISSKGKR